MAKIVNNATNFLPIEDLSVPPKPEPINEFTDEQIKRILLTPKVKDTIDNIIKKQTGVINAFDPEGYYYKELDDKETKKVDNSAIFKAYTRILNSYRMAQDYHEGKLIQKIKLPSYKLTIEDD